MSTPKMTKTQVKHFHYMADAMRRLEWDMHNEIYRHQRIPALWHEIARDTGPDKKVKITLGVEANLVRFFKSMGTGYQARMNDVMSAWMHGRLAGIVEGPETIEAFKFEMSQEPKWEWGDAQKLSDAARKAPE